MSGAELKSSIYRWAQRWFLTNLWLREEYLATLGDIWEIKNQSCHQRLAWKDCRFVTKIINVVFGIFNSIMHDLQGFAVLWCAIQAMQHHETLNQIDTQFMEQNSYSRAIYKSQVDQTYLLEGESKLKLFLQSLKVCYPAKKRRFAFKVVNISHKSCNGITVSNLV